MAIGSRDRAPPGRATSRELRELRRGSAHPPTRAGAEPVRPAIVSTYPPRACGIGTFAADLRGALIGVEGVEHVDVVAVVDEPARPQRRGLLSMIGQAVRGDYVRAARILGRVDVDVVLAPARVRDLRRAGRRVRAVVCRGGCAAARRDPAHRAVGAEREPARRARASSASRSELVIVMTDTARRLLIACGACAESKIRVVPHGAPSRLIAGSAPRASEPHARRDEPVPALDVRADLCRGRGSRRLSRRCPRSSSVTPRWST